MLLFNRRSPSCFPESGRGTWRTSPDSSWSRRRGSTGRFWPTWVWRTSVWSRTSPTWETTWGSWWRFWLQWLLGCHSNTTASTGKKQSQLLMLLGNGNLHALAIHRRYLLLTVTQGTAIKPWAINSQLLTALPSRGTVPRSGSPLHHPGQAAVL